MKYTSWSINLRNYDKRRANNGRERNPEMAGLDLEELKRYFLKSRGQSFFQCHKGKEMRKQENILQKGSDDQVEDQVLLPLASGWAKSICLYFYPTQRAGGIISTTDFSWNKRLTDHSTLCTLQTIKKWVARGWLGVMNDSSLILSLIFPSGLSYCISREWTRLLIKKL